MKRHWIIFTAALVISLQGLVYAKVDLVTLPKRASVQLTIYNSADLTLVRESRELTLKQGLNRLQFSWANTLIDPTSLDMLPKRDGEKIDILDLSYPPDVRNLGLWEVQSGIQGKAPVEINYLTSGLSWRAFYMGTLSPDEATMHLEGYVRVTNNSGEDYESAQVRLIVGKVNLIDQIALLAQREFPYGRPGPVPKAPAVAMLEGKARIATAKKEFMRVEEAAMERPKEIKKEGLSEYFLYTIEGTETIPNGWAKRLPSFSVIGIPVVNLYKYEEERYGKEVVRFLSFKNDKEHFMGETPIPGGAIKVYRTVDTSGYLSYAGQSNFKYIPVDEDVELNLGPVSTVIVKATLMDYKTDAYTFDSNGDVNGWNEIGEFEIEVKNTRDLPARVEVRRNFKTSSWEIVNTGEYGSFEKVDLDTVKYTLTLGPRETTSFRYTLTTHHGKRAY